MRKDIILILIATAALISATSYLISSNSKQNLQIEGGHFLSQQCYSLNQNRGNASTLYQFVNKCQVSVQFLVSFTNLDNGQNLNASYCVQQGNTSGISYGNNWLLSSTQYKVGVQC